MTEEWRPIAGFPGYEVSDAGRVRSVDRVIAASNGHSYRRRGVVLKQSPTSSALGYLQVTLSGRSKVVHQLVAFAFLGSRPPGKVVCHGPRGHLDNSLSNLRWGTPSENQQDSIRDGTNYSLNRTVCPRGHQLVHPNLVKSAARRGVRQCLACARARARIHVAKRRRRLVPDLVTTADGIYAELIPA